MLLSSMALYGQSKPEKKTFVVYATDGSILKGDLIGSANGMINMVLVTGDTIRVPSSLVFKMAQIQEKSRFVFPRMKYHSKEGNYLFLSWAFKPGWETVDGLFLTTGHRLKENINVGAGIGVFSVGSDFQGITVYNNFVPVFAYGRYYLNNKKRRLYVESKAGYGFANNNDWQWSHSGGVYFQPGIGIHFSSRKKSKFHLGINQIIAHTSGSTSDAGWGWPNTTNIDYNVWYNRTMITLGIEVF